MPKQILSEEFLRMQKLAGIVVKNNIYEEQEPDFSDLSKIDDLIGDELEKAEEKQPVTEIVGLTTAAFVLAIPGIVNGIAKIIKAKDQEDLSKKVIYTNTDGTETSIKLVVLTGKEVKKQVDSKVLILSNEYAYQLTRSEVLQNQKLKNPNISRILILQKHPQYSV